MYTDYLNINCKYLWAELGIVVDNTFVITYTEIFNDENIGKVLISMPMISVKNCCIHN